MAGLSSSPRRRRRRHHPETTITDLDEDAITHCTTFLTVRDICNLSMTSTTLKRLAYSDSVWQRYLPLISFNSINYFFQFIVMANFTVDCLPRFRKLLKTLLMCDDASVRSWRSSRLRWWPDRITDVFGLYCKSDTSIIQLIWKKEIFAYKL